MSKKNRRLGRRIIEVVTGITISFHLTVKVVNNIESVTINVAPTVYVIDQKS